MKKNYLKTFSYFLLPALFFISCQKKKNELSPETDQNSSAKIKSVQDDVLLALRNTPAETQELIKKCNEWFFARDISEDPFDDATGAKQYLAQPYSSGTMMLASGVAPGTVYRNVSISYSQYQKAFIPLVSGSYWWDECFVTHPANGNVPYGVMIAQWVAAFNQHNTQLTLKLDGVSILPSNLNSLRGSSGFWDFSIHPSWNAGCIASSTTFYADGYWAVVPLSLGVHELEIFGGAYFPRYKSPFSSHVIYTLTVTP